MTTTIINYADAHKHKRQRRASNVYMNSTQRKELISEVGDSGALLYTTYLEKSGIKNYAFEDKPVAYTLGWNTHKVKRYRLLLMQYDWFHQSTFTNAQGNKVRINYLGRDTVRAFKDDDHPIWQDFDKLNKVMTIMEVNSVEEIKIDLSRAKDIWENLDN
jgi:hypothetical protein